MKDRTNCKNRHANGNCLSVGGFCIAVDDKHCPFNPFEHCPFCGGKDIRLLDRTAWYDAPYNRGKRAVSCTDCGATMYGRNNEDAIQKWNYRTCREGRGNDEV